MNAAMFQQLVWEYYDQHGRHDLPWRLPEPDGSFDPYKILVSELMLQQTQVNRVIPKYGSFLKRFPDVASLANAPLSDVLIAWNGLGYNRRAKFLWQAALKIHHEYDGRFPDNLSQLVSLPGVGKNTAGAILAYTYDQPVVFIETNVRTVYIHHFFEGYDTVPDAAIVEKVAETVPRVHAREWYWALMDYGSYLKRTVGNASRASKSYKKQLAFHGSKRQIRGAVIRLLGQGAKSQQALLEAIADDRILTVLDELTQEQMIIRRGDEYKLA